MAEHDIRITLDGGRNKNLDWTTTHRAIFDGVLVVDAGFDNNIDRFTAVGARGRVRDEIRLHLRAS